MKIIEKETGDVILDVDTNRSLTDEEFLVEFGAVKMLHEHDDDPDYVLDGREIWLEALERTE